MKRQINRFLKLIWIFRQMHTPIWLMVSKRWYIYRGSPDLIVRYMSRLYNPCDSADLDRLIQEAKKEVEIRRVKKRYDKRN